MFSLIITIISIALVAALALATLYYGGSAFNKGSAGATAARLINEGQQLNGAIQVLRADIASNSVATGAGANLEDAANHATAKVSDLASAYVSQVPSAWDVDTSLGLGSTARGVLTLKAGAGGADLVTQAVCEEINKRAGHPAAGPADNTVGVYGCVNPTTAPAFYYAF